MRSVLLGAAMLCALAVVPAVVSGTFHPRRPALGQPAPRDGEVSLATALAWRQEVLWIDARPRAAYERGHLPGALLLNEDEWEQLLMPVLEAWGPRRRVVVYCDSRECSASTHVAERLRREAELPDVYVLHEGWQAWLRHETSKPR